MNTKKSVLMLILVLVSFVLGGCNSKKPEDSFKAYIDAWQKQDYATMYGMIAESSMEKVSEKDFIEKFHQKRYEDMEAKNISISIQNSDEIKSNDKGEVYIPYAFKMDTFAGPVEFTYKAMLIKEKGRKGNPWTIVWNQKMIYPELEDGYGLIPEKTKSRRGEILDRNGNGIAVNGYASEIGIVPGKFQESSIEALSRELNIPADSVKDKFEKNKSHPDWFVPIKTISNRDFDKKKDKILIPGVMQNNIKARTYPLGEAAAHLVGYVKDGTGVSGLEKIFDNRLKGQDGGIIKLVDSNKKTLNTIAEKSPVDGENITITIDSDLQQAIYNELKGDAGTSVAMHPKTGEVLAMVSSPSFDPNAFILGISNDDYKKLNDNPQSPFLDRFAKTFIPGSTFKPITASIALEKKVLNADEKIQIVGKEWQPNNSWGDYKVERVDDSHTSIDLNAALMYSDNIYFARTALKIGKDSFESKAKAFGLGEQLPFEYPLNPSQLSGKEGIDGEVSLADTGYGQGKVLMNPLHLGTIYTALLNQGNILQPVLEKKNAASPAKVWKEGAMSSDVASRVLEGLKAAVNTPGAPMNGAKVAGKAIAGKTGTAQVGYDKDGKTQLENGWFVGFNTDNPELLVVMLIENVSDRGGSHYVIPRVQNVMESYFKKH